MDRLAPIVTTILYVFAGTAGTVILVDSPPELLAVAEYELAKLVPEAKTIAPVPPFVNDPLGAVNVRVDPTEPLLGLAVTAAMATPTGSISTTKARVTTGANKRDSILCFNICLPSSLFVSVQYPINATSQKRIAVPKPHAPSSHAIVSNLLRFGAASTHTVADTRGTSGWHK